MAKFLIQTFIILLILIIPKQKVFCQSPQLINYQAVLRDSAGSAISNSNITVVLKITMGFEGSIAYQESQSTTTNQFGLFTLAIGNGYDAVGVFSGIEWSGNEYWLEVELNSEIISNTQFLSVPYALNAQTVVNNNDADADPANELNESFTIDSVTNIISITDAGGTLAVNLASIVDQFEDEDANPSNELNESFNLDTVNNIISITDGGGSLAVNLTSILEQVEDADADPTNEQNTDFTINNTTKQITIIDAGGALTIDLTTVLSQVEDGDSDPSNELIDNLTLTGNTITINENGTNHSLDLTPITGDDDWQIETGKIYNLNDKVGIGTSNPNSTLEVNGSQSVKVKYLTLGTTAYTIANDDYIVIANVSSNDVDITLPLASSCFGRIYTIKKAGPTPQPNDISILHSPSDFIEDSVLNLDLTSTSHESVTLVSAGAQGWYIISRQN
jgi:hypothetical protein